MIEELASLDRLTRIVVWTADRSEPFTMLIMGATTAGVLGLTDHAEILIPRETSPTGPRLVRNPHKAGTRPSVARLLRWRYVQ